MSVCLEATFKWNGTKNRIFDIECIVKWGDKINKVAFGSVKS